MHQGKAKGVDRYRAKHGRNGVHKDSPQGWDGFDWRAAFAQGFVKGSNIWPVYRTRPFSVKAAARDQRVSRRSMRRRCRTDAASRFSCGRFFCRNAA